MTAASTTTLQTHEETPANANAECVGPSSETAGKASGCEGCPNQGACSSGAYNSPEALAQAAQETQALQTSLQNVQHVVLVLSGKGGVGKSTVAAQMAHTLAAKGYAVGLLDVDLCGPSAPRMILGNNCSTQTIRKSGSGSWIPVYSTNNNINNQNAIAVMSISFLLSDPQQAVIWRGPRKNALIQQFLTEVDWTGETDGLDYLIVDTPPGTSDEHISTVQYLQKARSIAGAIVVTTPEEVSLSDVRKELSFCQKTSVPVLGVVENMGTFLAPLTSLQFQSQLGSDCTDAIMATLRDKCPEVLECFASTDVFAVAASKGGTERMTLDYNVPFWGRLPLDPQLIQCCEAGQAFATEFPHSLAANMLIEFAQRLVQDLPVAMEENENEN